MNLYSFCPLLGIPLPVKPWRKKTTKQQYHISTKPLSLTLTTPSFSSRGGKHISISVTFNPPFSTIEELVYCSLSLSTTFRDWHLSISYKGKHFSMSRNMKRLWNIFRKLWSWSPTRWDIIQEGKMDQWLCSTKSFVIRERCLEEI